MKNRQQKLKRYLPIAAIILIVLIVSAVLLTKKFIPAPSPSPSPTPSVLFNDFHLVIPSLDINAPVIADVDGADQKVYNKALEGGVAQLLGSAKPGEGSNIFIFGHSSFYWYKPGDYKKVFSTLDKLKTGDEIILWYNKKEYKYKVSETKIVWPNEVDVLKPTKKEQVSLMTCWPPNTTLKRMIVIGKLEN